MIANRPLGDHPALDLTGKTVSSQVSKAGIVSLTTSYDKYDVKYGFYNTETKHNIADKFWTFLNQTGPVRQRRRHHQRCQAVRPLVLHHRLCHL